MWILYIISLIPCLVGLILKHVFSKQIQWSEWLISSGVGVVLSLIFHGVIVASMTADVETWSGRIISATYHPYWRAEWTETYTTTDSKGRTHTHIRRCSANYPEHWTCVSDFGSDKREKHKISKEYFESICKQFGVTEPKPIKVSKPHRVKGDPNDYLAENFTKAIIPTVTTFNFDNRIKATPSLFSFVKPSDEECKLLYQYPTNNIWNASGRVIGNALHEVSVYEWDCLNSEVGPTIYANLILIGFSTMDSSIAQKQEALWIGGKKNDLVLCYGPKTDTGMASWAYVFGWTEQENVKRNLETLLLSNPINNDLLPKIKHEVMKNYVIKDWTKFDYITIEPSFGWILSLIIVMIFVQIGCYMVSYHNERK